MNDAKIRSVVDSTFVVLITRLGTAVILGLMGWQVATTQKMQIDVAVISAAVKDPYHAADANRDFALRDSRIMQNGQDIGVLYHRSDATNARVDAIAGKVEVLAAQRMRGVPFPQ